MSKKSRRRNRALGVIAGLMGAKALGMFGKTPVGSSGVVGKTPEFRKSFVKDKPILGKTKEFRKSFTSGKSEFPKLKVDSIGNVTKDGVTKVTKNTKTKFLNLDSSKGTGPGIYQAGKKVSGLNQKAINVLKDGKIETGGKTYANKEAYSKAMKAKRSMPKEGSGFKNFMNKFILGEKTQMTADKLVNARGCRMARIKTTKMY